MIIPPKLKMGDEIRVIAPALSMATTDKEVVDEAYSQLTKAGFTVTYGAHVFEKDKFNSTPVKARLEDLHGAFLDPAVKGILAADGGYNSNQLLAEIDWELMRDNPKIFCGYSDITALGNAIYTKTGLVTYSGPLYETFGMESGFEYSFNHFIRCVQNEEAFEVGIAFQWSDDNYEGEAPEEFVSDEGYWLENEGDAEGVLIGGNLSTINLLQGTQFMPPLENSILMIEDDYEFQPAHFDRCLTSLIQQPDFNKVRGLVFGRFEKLSRVSREDFETIIRTKKALTQIPVIGNANFGHTKPKFTFPIGGKGQIKAFQEDIKFSILEH